MVKLLRIVGDLNKSNTKIQANFTVPVKIAKNSKISFKSLKTEFLDSDVDETFEITSSNNTLLVGSETVTLDTGTYTLAELTNELNTQLPFRGSESGSGENYEVEYANDKFRFLKWSLTNKLADFNNEWLLNTGTPSFGTSDGYFDANGSLDAVQLISDNVFGNARFSFSGKVTTVGSFRVTAGDFFYTLAIVAGNWVYGALNTVIKAANINDTFSLTKRNGTVTYVVQGTTVTQTLTKADQEAINNGHDTNIWTIDADAGSLAIIENIRTQTFADTDQTDLSITLNTNKLARYLGFSQSGVAYKDKGDPALVESVEKPAGDPPGDILVCLDPMILESYSADSRVSVNGISNVIYSIPKAALGKVLEVDAPYPIPLDIKNNNETSISNLSITFRNRVNGELLRFVDDPVVVLLIFDS